MNKLRAAAYCRVSTDRAEQSGSLASQRSFFDDYIRNSDSMTLVGVFYDEGTSGTTTLNRYGFNKMISLAVSGGIDIILTKEVSRFARNPPVHVSDCAMDIPRADGSLTTRASSDSASTP